MLAVSEQTVMDIDLSKKSIQVWKSQSTKKCCVLQESGCKQFSPLQLQVTLRLESIPKCSEKLYSFVHIVFSQNMSMRPPSLLWLPLLKYFQISPKSRL